jgi:hypothetical protein
MASESARMASTAEARFRIQAPNSLPRAVKVIALDRRSEQVVKQLAESSWNRASFFTASALAGGPRSDQRFSMSGWLSDLAGRTKDLVDEIEVADLVVMVASAGERAEAAAIIGEACSLKRVSTTGLIVNGTGTTDAELTRTLTPLRPWSLMLVIAGDDQYVEDMLRALRA